MHTTKFEVSVPSASSATAPFITQPLHGIIDSISYVEPPEAGIAYDSGVDFTITNARTGETIWTENNVNASETIRPRPFAQKTDGTVLLYTTGEEVPTEGFMLANESLSFALANAGTDKTGVFIVRLKGEKG